jgi:periplasmic copper chaperone A
LIKKDCENMKHHSIIIALILCVLLAACAPAVGPAAAQGSIQIFDPWMRPAVMGSTGGAFMLIKNTGSHPDRLLSVTSSVAMMNEIHETKMSGDVMSMAPVASLSVPANGQVELKSGGYHIMMMNLKQEIKAGDKVQITLRFEIAGEVTFTVSVRD